MGPTGAGVFFTLFPSASVVDLSDQRMDRCHTHSSRGSSRAWRLIHASHALDRDTHQRIVDEIGDCESCWRDTALAGTEAASSMMVRCWGVPGMDGHGNVDGPGVDWLLDIIASSLECEEADRRDLERGP
jgi:hypothetical protein